MPDSTSKRFAIVAGIIVVLLLPLFLLGGVVSERQHYHAEAMADIAQGWGREQQIIGPIIVIPVIDHVAAVDKDGVERARDRQAHHVILPATLEADVTFRHEWRRRAIYEIPVYLAEVTLSGRFDEVARLAIESRHKSVLWAQAKIVVGIGDTRAIREASDLTLNGKRLTVVSGTGVEWLESGVSIPVPLPATPGEFRLSFVLAGTRHFSLSAVGGTNVIEMASDWPHPKFTGEFLPTLHQISAEGFTASWQISSLARGVPGNFVQEQQPGALTSLDAGVSLHQPVTIYTAVERGIKYGVLFVALTFLTFLCFELVAGLRFHFVQYGVVGLGLILFYLTLLSLSEHLVFVAAYLFSTIVIVGMIAWYVRAITRSWLLACVVAAVEGGLYGVLYVILQLEDLALLTGTAVLLLGLAALMRATRSLGDASENKTTTVIEPG